MQFVSDAMVQLHAYQDTWPCVNGQGCIVYTCVVYTTNKIADFNFSQFKKYWVVFYQIYIRTYFMLTYTITHIPYFRYQN